MKKALVAVIATAIALAFFLAPRPAIETSIDIAASPAKVWAVLTDLPRYPEWNPTMRLAGSLVPGATIENLEGNGDDRMTFWPTVLVARAPEELRWRGHLKIPAVFSGEHYFLLRPNGSGTTLIQGEHFSGLALWFYDVRGLAPVFARVNQALKTRTES